MNFKSSWQDASGEWYGRPLPVTEYRARRDAEEARMEGNLNCGVDEYITGEGWKRVITLEDLQEAVVTVDVITDISELGMTARELAAKIFRNVDIAMAASHRCDSLLAVHALSFVQRELKKVLEGK